MKKFFEGGEYFVLSSYRIKAVPIAEDSKVSIELAKTICEDACYLSASGNGQTSIEILRIAGGKTGSCIHHLLTIRTHDTSEQECVIRQEALDKGVLSLLHHAGFLVEEISFEGYRQHLSGLESDSVWALRKQDIQEYGVQGTYKSPSVVENVSWNKIYSALDGSGCGLCIQIIPALLSDSERQLIAKTSAQCSQAVDGVLPNMRDSLATASAERWKYYAQEFSHPFAEVNIMVIGAVTSAALVTARIKQSIKGAAFRTIAVSEYRQHGIYNHPWKIGRNLNKADSASLHKWTSDEVSQIFQLPTQSNFFVGIERNAFSLMPEVDLLSEQLTIGGNQSLFLGKSIFSSQSVYVPLEQLLLHTAVMGKSGVGKTTLLKRIIAQLQSCDIPVLILEPIKREYRDLVAIMKDSKIFSVERPVTPLLINPFYVPKDVPLGEYRSSLLSAFKAAFSMPDPLPALFEKAISEAYTLHGWTDTNTSDDNNVSIFDMADFVRTFKRVIARSCYSNEVKGNMMSGGAFRLQSLIERCPRTFDTIHSTSVEDLLNGCAVLEMGSLEPEQKSLVSALTLISILAYLKSTRKSNHYLRNIILIDEAHALLDQGEGATQEEKALNSTMTQLMINVITEIRAYGVGVVFSDQSPSRVGGRMLDNVDSIMSFRLSGEEADMLREHIGADTNFCDVLPLMSRGEFVLKNRFLRSALPIRMEYSPDKDQLHHISDEQIVKAQAKYLTSHAKDYCPFTFCEGAGCDYCTVAIREEAKMYAEQIFAERQLKLNAPDEIAAHIVRIPSVLSIRIDDGDATIFKKKSRCVAVHLLRKCSIENGISFSLQAVKKLLSEMDKQGKGGTENE
jgi:hypothetical protein